MNSSHPGDSSDIPSSILLDFLWYRKKFPQFRDNSEIFTVSARKKWSLKLETQNVNFSYNSAFGYWAVQKYVKNQTLTKIPSNPGLTRVWLGFDRGFDEKGEVYRRGLWKGLWRESQKPITRSDLGIFAGLTRVGLESDRDKPLVWLSRTFSRWVQPQVYASQTHIKWPNHTNHSVSQTWV